MKHANPFLLLVAFVPAFTLLWGWIPAVVVSALSIGAGFLARRALNREGERARWDLALPLARVMALALLAALGALSIGEALHAIFELGVNPYARVALWPAPVAACLAIAIISTLPQRWIARPLTLVAGWLLPVILLVAVAGLARAALVGVELPAYDDEGNALAPERIALRWAAPHLVWQPHRFPPLPTAAMLVLGAGALALASRDAARTSAPRARALAGVSIEVAIALLALLACTLGLSLGTPRQVTQSGSSGYNDRDRSYIDGSYLWVNDRDGTYAFLSEMRSPDIVETGYANRLHPRATLRVALFFSPDQGMAYSWGSVLPPEYSSYFDPFITAMLQQAGVYRNEMERGQVGIGRVENGQWRRLPTTLIEDFENDALVRTFRLPSGTVRFDRDAQRAVITGSLAHSAHFQYSHGRSFVGSVLDALAHGSANLVHALGVPKRGAVTLAWCVLAFFAIVLLEHALRCLRLAIRDLAHAFVPQSEGPACGRCGYDLRGVRSRSTGATLRCPECGETRLIIPPGEVFPLPKRASPFNPARWLGSWPASMLLAFVFAASCVVVQGYGWRQQWVAWQWWLATADIALAFAAFCAAQALLATALLTHARSRPGAHFVLRAVGFTLLFVSAVMMTALAFVGIGETIPWRRWSRLQGLAPSIAIGGLLATVLMNLAREAWVLTHRADKDKRAT